MLTVADYSSQYASSTISSDTLSGSVSSVQPRIRTVRLVRPSFGTLPPSGLMAKHGPNLGFSIRGGREHGTGFFVSCVESGSEAHRNGLKVGDQIIRINGFTVEDAVHKEVLQLISNHTHLTLKVRSVGMIPVKDRCTDPLSWQIISDSNSSTRSSPQLGEKIHDVRINIMVAPRTKLGCGICKGPEWKPGIFIQFTKEGGIAREAGLRPGDQIVYCNNVDFSDIPFNEAVNIMKSARQLDLLVRKSSGAELFPGESSGYNSSASSVTGDQSPSWSDSKRLSIVKEESAELEDRLCQLKSSKLWKEDDWEDDSKVSYKPMMMNFKDKSPIARHNSISSEYMERDRFRDANATLTRSMTSSKLADIRLVSHQQETKTVVVEVHKSDNIAEERQLLAEKKEEKETQKESVSDTSSGYDSSSLSSALSQEIRKRMERKKIEPKGKPSIDEELQKKKILKGVSTDQQSRHTKLMDEFKLVHRKMFRNSEEQVEKEGTERKEEGVLPENEPSSPASPKANSDRDYSRITTKVEPRGPSPLTEASQRVPSPKQNGSLSPVSPPPPPPPPPSSEQAETIPTKSPIGSHLPSPVEKSKVKQPPPVPVKYSCLSAPNKTSQKNGQPSPCPTPDYDNLNITTNYTLPRSNGKIYAKPEVKASQVGNVNLVNNHTTPNGLAKTLSNGVSPPKCPPLPNPTTNKAGSENSTLKKRPVSVVIGEYPSDTLRRQPGKLDFLQNSSDETDRSSQSSGDSISSQLASELALTLSRSNLRRRTESVENLTSSRISSQSNGTVTISVGSNLIKNFARSTDNLLFEDGGNKIKSNSNRVLISIGSQDKSPDFSNNIFANGNGNKFLQHKC